MSPPKDRTDPLWPKAARDDATTDPGLPEVVDADLARFEHILSNMTGTARIVSPEPVVRSSSNGHDFAAYQAVHNAPKPYSVANHDARVVVDVAQPDRGESVANACERDERAELVAGPRDRGATTVLVRPSRRGMRQRTVRVSFGVLLAILLGAAVLWSGAFAGNQRPTASPLNAPSSVSLTPPVVASAVVTLPTDSSVPRAPTSVSSPQRAARTAPSLHLPSPRPAPSPQRSAAPADTARPPSTAQPPPSAPAPREEEYLL